MKKKIRLLLALIYGSVVLRLPRNEPCRVILYYHVVPDDAVERFAKQMQYLAETCHVVAASEILTAEPGERRAIVSITFDDAYASILRNAFPILREYGLTASVFVPTGNLSQNPRWQIPPGSPQKSECVMSEDDIRKLDEDGHEILSHTVSHPDLTLLSDTFLKAELSQSKVALERILGHDVIGVSYPHGAHNARVCEAAAQAGYRMGFTIEPHRVDSRTDNMRIGRFVVSPTDRHLEFTLKARGAYEVMGYVQRVKRKLWAM